MAHLQCAKVIPGSKFEVFAYLANPAHLSEQLEGCIEVTWENPGVEVKQGSEFLFNMTRFGIAQPIRFLVDRVVTGHSLSIRQINGVYARFVHTMKFEEHGQNETLVTDFVDYDVPFGILGRIADDFWVRNDMQKLLEKRLQKAYEKFSSLDSENKQDIKKPTTDAAV